MNANNGLNFVMLNKTSNSSHQIRTFINNSYTSSVNSFIIFTSSQLILYKNNILTTAFVYSVPNIAIESIVDSVFSEYSMN